MPKSFFNLFNSSVRKYEDESRHNEIIKHLNVIVVGATGAGKTYYISALGNAACKKAKNVKYVRLPDLLYDLDQARNKESYKKKLKYYARADLLIIDEWLLNPTTA